ncbi:bifunctional hydroxymethylpyrimidine kinase/phosphomethylpyrimidine kinase [Desulfohalovibrio reitneri]|uniref:bifunctional hydroxymethylpyrimidine kinase/phosphomethylpyrimidine kinase n=1 Tax=Desulfohalovibrio reitneri TaxID=1307759 RepID=UPI0004A75628|nr:bifunctional hydroxymethylpyrimidine kinase/phosphomethylpyrimidine kinase [Desulfohalovibrio reitneri]
MKEPCQILTIAGSDSGGGAGIQADLKTFAMLGTYGASVITALTAQNSMGVRGVSSPDPEFVGQQLDAVLGDLDIRAAKTGMLFSSEIIRVVAEKLRDRSFPLVVDPVSVAASGDRLLKADALGALKEEILPQADLLTPNRQEAELLAGLSITSREECFTALRRIRKLGPKAVLIKGGHFDEFAAVTDWLLEGDGDPVPLMQPKVATANLHGTGCTLAAAIAAELGKDADLVSAISRAQSYLNRALRASFQVGAGPGPAHHGFALEQAGQMARLPQRCAGLARRLAALPGMGRLLDGGWANLALAPNLPAGPEQVVSLEGGLRLAPDGSIFTAGCPAFGAAEELGRRLVACERSLGGVNAALELEAGETVLPAASRTGPDWLLVPRPPAEREDTAGPVAWEYDEHLLSFLDEHAGDGKTRVLAFEGGGGRVMILAADPEELLQRVAELVRACGGDAG